MASSNLDYDDTHAADVNVKPRRSRSGTRAGTRVGSRRSTRVPSGRAVGATRTSERGRCKRMSNRARSSSASSETKKGSSLSGQHEKREGQGEKKLKQKTLNGGTSKLIWPFIL